MRTKGIRFLLTENYGPHYKTKKVRSGSRLCKNADAETFRATIESGKQRGRIIVAAKAKFMTQCFVSVSKN